MIWYLYTLELNSTNFELPQLLRWPWTWPQGMRGRRTKSKKFVALSPLGLSPSLWDEMGDRIELTHYYTVVLHKGRGTAVGKKGHDYSRWERAGRRHCCRSEQTLFASIIDQRPGVGFNNAQMIYNLIFRHVQTSRIWLKLVYNYARKFCARKYCAL